MHILFIHQAFPAQFGRLALELTQRYDWRCSFLIESLSNCPTPSRAMLDRLEIHTLPLSQEFREDAPKPWPQIYARYLELCQSVDRVVRSRSDLKPDLIVAHGGRGAPTLFVRDAVECPIVNYCEYFFAPSRADISYRIDLPPVDPSFFFPRCINGPTLSSLVTCDAGYSATRWQRDSFPERFRSKIEVLFDGVDTEMYQPQSISPQRASQLLGGRSLPEGTRVVTYVARGLESMRGFDIFMRVAKNIAHVRSDVLFVVVGSEEVYYGWDRLHTGQPSFKQWVLSQDDYDLSRFVFLDHVLPEHLAELVCLSDLHFYLTVPFVLSWSLFNALACGRVVLASEVAPVLEVIEPGVNGLVEGFYDIPRLTETALRVLADPAAFHPLGVAAQERIEEDYSHDVSVPKLRDFFERTAGCE